MNLAKVYIRRSMWWTLKSLSVASLVGVIIIDTYICYIYIHG